MRYCVWSMARYIGSLVPSLTSNGYQSGDKLNFSWLYWFSKIQTGHAQYVVAIGYNLSIHFVILWSCSSDLIGSLVFLTSWLSTTSFVTRRTSYQGEGVWLGTRLRYRECISHSLCRIVKGQRPLDCTNSEFMSLHYISYQECYTMGLKKRLH